MHIFTNIRDFENNYDEIKKLSEDDKLSIDNYFCEGGLIKTSGKNTIELVYPSKDIINKELNEIYAERSKVIERLEQWRKIKKDSEEFIEKNKIKKFLKTTYWKHKLKETTDKNYKTDFAKIRIPIEYIGDESMKKVIDTFISDSDYRKKLIETMDNSIVYKNKGIGEKVLKKLDLQKEISKNKLDILNTRKNKLDNRIRFYKIILKWV